MKNKMYGFIDPYGLSLIVVLLGALSFDVHKSFEPKTDHQEQTQEINQNLEIIDVDPK